ncbi:MAG TPA: hydrogenase maturation nickel metallochaperone HypA, partial [Cyanobacteria bacterium UBA8543]|nr:hydrogenase maturation nickel metallochaperone HypA [Cyanobacteria bacterium UBA8543]
MHELGITQNIVAIAAEHANGAKVKRVSLEIGKLSAIMPEAVHFCFDICCQGTVLEGAKLEIIEIPG